MAGTFCFIQTFSLNYYLLYYFSHHPWWFLDTALMVIKSIKQLYIIIISLTCILFSLKVKFNFHPIIWNSGIWLMVNSSDRGERVKIYTVDDICTYFQSAQRIQNEVQIYSIHKNIHEHRFSTMFPWFFIHVVAEEKTHAAKIKPGNSLISTLRVKLLKLCWPKYINKVNWNLAEIPKIMNIGSIFSCSFLTLDMAVELLFCSSANPKI